MNTFCKFILNAFIICIIVKQLFTEICESLDVGIKIEGIVYCVLIVLQNIMHLQYEKIILYLSDKVKKKNTTRIEPKIKSISCIILL